MSFEVNGPANIILLLDVYEMGRYPHGTDRLLMEIRREAEKTVRYIEQASEAIREVREIPKWHEI